MHPVDSLEETNVAIGGAGLAFLELSGLPSSEQHSALLVSLQKHLGLSHKDAEEAVVLGRWLINECGGASPGFERLVRRLSKLDPSGGFAPLMSVLKEVAASSGAALSDQQRDALQDTARIFRIS